MQGANLGARICKGTVEHAKQRANLMFAQMQGATISFSGV